MQTGQYGNAFLLEDPKGACFVLMTLNCKKENKKWK